MENKDECLLKKRSHGNKTFLFFSCFQIIHRFESLFQGFYFFVNNILKGSLPTTLQHRQIQAHPKAVLFNSQPRRHEAGQECGSNLPGLLQTQQSGPRQCPSSYPKVKPQVVIPFTALTSHTWWHTIKLFLGSEPCLCFYPQLWAEDTHRWP